VFWNADEPSAAELAQIQVQAAAGWLLVHIVPTMACIFLSRRWQNAP
jgi:hypothetical protein